MNTPYLCPVIFSNIASLFKSSPMKLPVATLLLLLLIPTITPAQTLFQTVRGTVVESETQFPLIGATVILVSDTSRLTGVTTDVEGNFRLTNVPVGRQTIKVSYVGYEDAVVSNIQVTSGKEVVLTISLKESAVSLAEITIVASRDGEASNEMATVSARSFTIEETERYAGSRGDPARMASNFAGVQGADDSRNDIVIRGNSPQAVLWRMEGINIPNPNHFNIPGTAGGPVSMINNKTLSNSDFYTGAFPAEFGNSVAGVFDLKLRNGNREKHEWSGQFGFLGTEIFGEGPMSRNKKSSYLVSYRYSSLALFSKLGIDIGTEAIPRYQDGAFKFNFPLKNNGSLALFGLGGKSNIDILISEQEEEDRNIYGSNDRDQYFGTSAGLVGLQYKQPLNADSYISATVAASTEEVWANHQLVSRHTVNRRFQLDSLSNILDYTFTQGKLSGVLFYARKLRGGTINAGVNSDVYLLNFIDSARNIVSGQPEYWQWRTRWDARDQALLFQPFFQWKFAPSPNTELIAGLHSQYFSLSGSLVMAEPRVGLKWKASERTTLNFGAGLHSQVQPTYLYYYGSRSAGNGEPILDNKNLGFTRSVHVVSGLQRMLRNGMRLKTEVYYQYLFDVPVDKDSVSSFSLVNSGAGFSRYFPYALANAGVGHNYGAEFTLERFFSKGYLFLLTGALFEAKYKGSDDVWRDTDFNGNYAVNALFTKEWSLRSRNTISLGGKMTTAGGRRYGPVDAIASEREKDVIFEDETRNTLQFRPYFRLDFRVNYKINRPKTTHEIAVDFVNVLGTKNILKLTYAPASSGSNIREEYQLGFLPLFYYRIDF